MKFIFLVEIVFANILIKINWDDLLLKTVKNSRKNSINVTNVSAHVLKKNLLL